MREQLRTWQLETDLEAATELIVSELVGNTIRRPSDTDGTGRGPQLVAATARR